MIYPRNKVIPSSNNRVQDTQGTDRVRLLIQPLVFKGRVTLNLNNIVSVVSAGIFFCVRCNLIDSLSRHENGIKKILNNDTFECGRWPS